MHEQKVYELAFGHVKGLGSVLVRQLISYCGSARAVFQATRGRLLKIPGTGLEKPTSLG